MHCAGVFGWKVDASDWLPRTLSKMLAFTSILEHPRNAGLKTRTERRRLFTRRTLFGERSMRGWVVGIFSKGLAAVLCLAAAVWLAL